jgi:hypothetical protein
MSTSSSSVSRSSTTAALTRDLNVRLRNLHQALQAVVGTVRQLEQHADFVTAIAQGRPVKIRHRREPLPDGQRRGRGRPPGTPNGFTYLWLPDPVIERLRAESVAWPHEP